MLADTGVLLQIANNPESLASFYIFSLDGGGIWVTFRGTSGYSWFCAQGPHLEVLRDHVVLENKQGLGSCARQMCLSFCPNSLWC